MNEPCGNSSPGSKVRMNRMAKTNASGKRDDAPKPNKFVGFFKNIGLRVAQAFVDTYHELHKVTWATRKDLINYSLVVLVFLVFMGIVVGAFDTVAGKIIMRIVGGGQAS